MSAGRRIIEEFRQRYGGQLDLYQVPPPSFTLMEGEFVDFDADAGWLITRFPVRREYLNPYGSVQGGLLAAAVDNTLGPLSMLLAPPNVTRRLELKYSRAVTLDMGSIEVKATLIGWEGQWLDLKAEVRNLQGELLARARAQHWILEQP